MAARVAVTMVIAILGGVVFTLRDWFFPPRHVPVPFEDLILFAWVLALAAIGWTASQLLGRRAGVLLAPVAALVAIGVALFAKAFRFPTAPLVGDGFEILIWGYLLVAAVAATVGGFTAIRARSASLAAAIGTIAVLIAGTIGAIPYVLAAQ